MQAAVLHLYIRQGCHLCEAFLDEMRLFNDTLAEQVVIIDVDDIDEVRQRLGDKVPVLFADGLEVCRYYFDANKIKSCLKLNMDSLE